jgi:HK97 family phage prohead protease
MPKQIKKMQTNLQTRTAQLRGADSTDPENRTYEFVISSETPDTYGTVFLSSGWSFERYMKNPVVLYNHRSYSDNPDTTIGTSLLRMEGKEIIATLTLETGNEIADKVKRQLDNGTLRMASIGADVHEYRRGIFEDGENPDLIYLTRQDLLEWSITPVGSNPDALKRNADFLDTAFAKAPLQQRETAKLDEFQAEYMYNLNNQ